MRVETFRVLSGHHWKKTSVKSKSFLNLNLGLNLNCLLPAPPALSLFYSPLTVTSHGHMSFISWPRNQIPVAVRIRNATSNSTKTAWMASLFGSVTCIELERSMILHREFGDLPRLMYDQLVLGDLKMWLESWAESLAHYEQAVRLAGDLRGQSGSIASRARHR